MIYYIIGLILTVSNICYADPDTDPTTNDVPHKTAVAGEDADADADEGGNEEYADPDKTVGAYLFDIKGNMETPSEFMNITENDHGKDHGEATGDPPTNLSDPGKEVLGILGDNNKREEKKRDDKEKSKEVARL